jgi:phenylacetate-coenzyme A ligase PaaK-like adenylate-forming protein
MSFFHLRTLPGYSWPALPDASLSQVWVAYQELGRGQWLAPEEIERRQLEQVRTLLTHALAQVPYYRRTLAEAGISPAAVQTPAGFRRVPPLSRSDCQAHQAYPSTAG